MTAAAEATEDMGLASAEDGAVIIELADGKADLHASSGTALDPGSPILAAYGLAQRCCPVEKWRRRWSKSGPALRSTPRDRRCGRRRRGGSHAQKISRHQALLRSRW
jgi:hypothetical protein